MQANILVTANQTLKKHTKKECKVKELTDQAWQSSSMKIWRETDQEEMSSLKLCHIWSRYRIFQFYRERCVCGYPHEYFPVEFTGLIFCHLLAIPMSEDW